MTGENSYIALKHPTCTGTNAETEYEIVRCPNKFDFRENHCEHGDNTKTADVFHVTQNDNGVDLSIERRKFIEIMEKGIRKNELGNWEVPLPFRSSNTPMPYNRSYAVKRLKGLLQTMRRKPRMERD